MRLGLLYEDFSTSLRVTSNSSFFDRFQYTSGVHFPKARKPFGPISGTLRLENKQVSELEILP